MFNYPNSPNALDKIIGAATVGIQTKNNLEVIYYKKTGLTSQNRPVSLDEIYILLDERGRLFASSTVVIIDVISKGKRVQLLDTSRNMTGFSLKGGGKQYYIRGQTHGFIVNYDQYGNMMAKVHYKFDNLQYSSPPKLLFNPIEVAFIKKKQKQRIRQWKEETYGYRRRNNNM